MIDILAVCICAIALGILAWVARGDTIGWTKKQCSLQASISNFS